jgi:E3 ubiquitin-protein ligase HUWE1
VTELINQLLATPKAELTDVLAKIDIWTLPRSDLNAWIKVLNKFDEILEETIITYDIDNLQKTDFSPEHKALLSEVLRFERLLLENTTNRKSFNSYDVRRAFIPSRVYPADARSRRESTACCLPPTSTSSSSL